MFYSIVVPYDVTSRFSLEIDEIQDFMKLKKENKGLNVFFSGEGIKIEGDVSTKDFLFVTGTIRQLIKKTALGKYYDVVSDVNGFRPRLVVRSAPRLRINPYLNRGLEFLFKQLINESLKPHTMLSFTIHGNEIYVFHGFEKRESYWDWYDRLRENFNVSGISYYNQYVDYEDLTGKKKISM